MTDVLKARSQSASPDGIWGPALKEAGVSFMAAALLLAIFYVFAFRWIHPEFVPFMDREATKLIAPGKDLIPVSVGAYRVEGSTGVIEDFNGDEAILALPRAFQAEDYPFIKVNLQGFTRYSKFKILWRRAEDPSQTYALELNRGGDKATQIAMVYGDQNYRGQIADIALLFYDGPALGFENNNKMDITISDIELRPFATKHVIEQIFEDWINPPLWKESAHNVVRGVHSNGMLLPNAVSNLLVVTGFAVSIVWRLASKLLKQSTFKPRALFVTTLCLCAFGWAFNDALRWTGRIEQFKDSNQRYAGRPLEEKILNNDTRCARFPSDCKADLLPYF